MYLMIKIDNYAKSEKVFSAPGKILLKAELCEKISCGYNSTLYTLKDCQCIDIKIPDECAFFMNYNCSLKYLKTPAPDINGVLINKGTCINGKVRIEIDNDDDLAQVELLDFDNDEPSAKLFFNIV